MSEPLIVALGGRVVGLSVATGDVLWHNELQGSGVGYVALAVTTEFVVVSASAARLFCLSRESGEIVWSGKTTGLGRATILIQESQVFIAKSGNLDCFHLLTGQLEWTKGLHKLGKKSAALGLTNNVVQADG
jgi:outer membrane protein assembly factor BamB